MAYQPGHPGGPGRPKGSRNKRAESFLDALYAHFQEHGVAALDAACLESPLGYCRMIASLLPQKFEIEKAVADLSDAELAAIIRGGADRDAEPAVRGNGEAVH